MLHYLDSALKRRTYHPKLNCRSSIQRRRVPMRPASPLIWEYLTYETPLPKPAHLFKDRSSLDDSNPPPQCPDLRSYVSPFQWSEKRKSFITWLSCAATVITAYTAGSYSAGTEQMAREWHVSDVAITVGVTTFTCGFAMAPMFLAPFSEINGRRPIFVVTGALFVIFQLCCAVTRSYGGMLVSRFLAGCASSTFSTMVGGVVSDIYHAEDRNAAMSLFSGAALFGTGLGPLVSGVIAKHTTWRWIFYLQVITCGVMMGLIVFFFKETRGSVLLSRKAKKLNQWYEELESQGYYGTVFSSNDDGITPLSCRRVRWKVKSDEERAALGQMIKVSLYRPFYLLFTEPVVFFFSLWISFSWSVLYLTFAAVPLVFETSHGFDIEQSGAVFAAISVAAVLSTFISIYQEKLARKYLVKHTDMLNTPEGRLYFACIQSALLPIGCFWFGWSSFPTTPWIVPTLAVGCATMGIFSIYLAVFNYLADTYHRYASSALAAQSFCRNMMGGAFPLFTRQMFNKMTFQGAGSFLGGFSALLTLVPWILVFYGPRIRARSKFAREIMNDAI
ncbi:MFS multidrug transporter [Polychaeton citri CBS 116435]|uniref:MFS multidrug transporter n=1 Tax=Polychaeton citri CBS 116435 TaxID=1314669 RepID=A0A9P4USS0_9PEZI|nr:MFS multidrug transporter [Polychaeton citri CBS 116435]